MLRPVFTLLLCALASLAIAQGPFFRGLPHSPKNTEALDIQFGEYQVFRIDAASLNAYAKAENGARPFRLQLGDRHDWNLEIFARDIRAANYSILVATEAGVTEMRAGENNTFRGQLLQAGGGMVSLTLDVDFIYGYITEGDEEFFIEPLWYFIPDASKDLFLVYPASKVIPVEGKTCGVTEMEEHKPHIDPEDMPEVGNCLRLQLAIANDWAMRQKYGSNAAVINHNVGVMNNVQNNYDNEFADEIDFFIVQHYISSCSTCDPWTSSTNPNTLLNSFTNWGPGGFSAVHDLGQLWTNRDLDGSVIGIAWLNAVCTNIRYHVLQDFTTNAQLLRVLAAHEIGHNFSATHDAQGSNTIMAPSVSNTNTWSNQSINQINNFIQTVDPPNGCLAFCPPPCALTVSASASPNTVCAGQPSVLTATPSGGTAPYNYTWSTGGNQQTTTVNPNATTTYSVTVTDAAGCLGTASVTVTVSPPPTPVATNNSPLCQGGTLVLAASGGVTYNWTGPNGFTSTLPNPTIPNAQPVNSGTYNVTVTNATGCSASTSTFAVVNPNPGAVAGSNSPVCQGSAINLNAGGGGTYSWSGPNGYSSNQQNPVIPNAQVANGGQYTVTVSLNGCTNTASTTVVVNPSPTASASSNSPVCQGATIQLNGSGSGGTFSWSGPGGFSSTLQNPTISNAQPANSGTYTLTLTNTNGCTATSTVSVTVTPQPVASAGNNSPVCQGSTLILASSGGSAYSWSGPNGYTSNLQNPTIPNVQAANAGTYTVTVTNANCSATATTHVLVNPSPVAASSSNSPVCQNGTINLSASGGSSYSWSGPGGFSSNQQNPVIPNAQVQNSGTYTVTVTAAGCSSTSSVPVTVTPLPAAGAGSNAPVCQGGTLVLAGFGGGTYSWSGPNGFTSTQPNPNIPNVQPANAGTYSVTVTANGCSASATTSVAINPQPAAAANSNGPVCEGATLSLSASGGGTYSWSGPNGFTSNQQNPSIANAQAANAGTYSVTVTNAGCTASATTTVSVNPGPSASAGGSTPVCEGETIELSASGGNSYSWSGPNGFSSNEQNPVIPNAGSSAAGVYTVTVGDGLCTDAASVAIAVTPLPNAVAGSNAPVCEGGDILLAASGGTSYSWSGPNGFSSNEQNPVIGNAQGTNAGTYTVVVSANGCNASASSTVAVNAVPEPSAASNTPVCIGSDLLLSAQGGASYSWSGPNGFSSNEQNPVLPNAQAGDSGTYTVTVSNGSCSASTQVSVEVNPGPAAAAAANGPVCEGETIELSASGGDTYSWSGPNGFVSSEQNPVIPNAQPGDSGAYTVMVTAPGCSAFATTTVEVRPLPDPQAASNTPICEGETLQLSAANGDAYAWSGPGGFSSSEQSPVIAEATLLNAGTYTVTVTNNGCSASESVTVAVTALPKPEAQSNTPVCEGDDILLTATGGTSYSWSGPDGFTSSEQNPLIPGALGLNAGEYTVIVTLNGCSTDAKTLVVVNPLPQAVASGSAMVCEGETISLTASGGGNYLWSGPSGFVSTEQNPVIPAAQLGNAGAYFVTVSLDGCEATAQAEVSVTPLPEAAASGTSPMCEGETIHLIASGGGTYAWSGPGGFSSDLAEPALSNAQPGNSGMYVVVVSENGCSASAEVEILVNPLPEAVAAANGPLCQGETLELSASGGETYSWSGPNGFLSEEQHPFIGEVQTGDAGMYAVTVSSNGCSSTAEVMVEVNLVTAQASSTGETCHDCNDGTATVEAQGAGGYTYLWSNGATDAAVSGLAPGTYSVTVTGNNGCTAVTSIQIVPFGCPAIEGQLSIEGPACQGDLATVAVTPANGVEPYEFLWSTGETTQTVIVPAGIYTVNITDADGCPGTLEVTVEDGPEVIPAIEGDTLVCDGEAGALTASGGSAYLWSTGETTPVITWTESGEYSVEVTEGACTKSTSVTVEVNPPLVLDLGQTDGQIVAVVSGGSGNYSYLWNTGETTSSISPTEPGIYSVTVTDEKGCKTVGEVDFTVSTVEAGKQLIRVFPNPTLHRVFVEAPSGLEGWIYAHDLLGNLIASQPLGIGEVDLSGQAAGSYLLQVVVGEEVYRVKVVKQ